jgi:nucleoside-diphosphate-sugar epimerase
MIVHGASPAIPRVYTKNPSELFISNGLGTYHLFSLAREKKSQQFLFLSSGEVYGRVDPSKFPQNESTFGEIDPMRVRSCYAESKRFAENMCACLQMEFGVPAKVARLCHTFGPGVRLDDGRVYADFLRDIVDGGPIHLKSDGTAQRTFCYLADATEALFTILLKGVDGQAYNVAPPNCLTTIGELAELLAASFSNGKVERPAQAEHAPLAINPGSEIWPAGEADVSKLLSLGWTPKTSLIECFDRTLHWLKRSEKSENGHEKLPAAKIKVHNPLAKDLEMVLSKTEDVFEQLRGQRILITGGTGFFGKWLLECLQFAEAELGLDLKATVLTRNKSRFESEHGHLLSKNITLCQGDVVKFSVPDNRFDYIIHAATESATHLNEEDPLRMLRTIYDGTRQTLELAEKSGCKSHLLISSGAVYGQQPVDLKNVSEDYTGSPDPTDVRSAYAEGKRAAELMSTIWAQNNGFESKIARCFAFVGPYLSIRAHFAIGNFIRDVLCGDPINIKGDGTPFRSYMYAADLMVWLWTILLKGRSGQAYNVGSEEEHSLLEVAQIVSEHCSPPARITVSKKPDPSVKPTRYVPSTLKASQELGLSLYTPLPEAVAKTIAWHKEVSTITDSH